MTLMVDSNILIFLINENSQRHESANEKFTELLEKGHKFVVNSLIIAEVTFELGKCLGLNMAKKEVSKLLDSKYIEYEPIEEYSIKRAIKKIKTNHRKTIDTIIGLHAKDLGLKIFTDNVRDFKKIVGERNIIDLN